MRAAPPMPGEGLAPFYHPGGTSCPDCCGTSWHVGRTSAECANERCSRTLAFRHDPTPRHIGTIWRQDNQQLVKAALARRAEAA